MRRHDAGDEIDDRINECTAGSGGGARQRIDDIVDDPLHQNMIVALSHDANQRLCPRGANHQTAMVAKPLQRVGNRRLNLVVVEGTGATKTHVFQDLRDRFEPTAHFRHRSSLPADDGKHLQCGDQTIARRRIIIENDVSGLLATDVIAMLAHVLDDISVANPRACQRQTNAPEIAFESQI